MNKDIRLSVDFVSHRKRKKLQRMLGAEGVLSLIDFWLTTSVQRSLGVLEGYDDEDIELDANWGGEPGKFVEALLKCGFLEKNDGVFCLHNWKERQEWVAESDVRADKARFSRLAKLNPEMYQKLKSAGKTGVSKDEFNEIRAGVNNDVNQESTIVNDRSTTVNESFTPAPAPAPAPAPYVRKEEEGTLTSTCPEPQSDSRPPDPESPPAVISIPVKGKDGGEFEITTKHVDEWQVAYPGIDVMQSLRSIRQWNLANPTRQKTRRGVMRHIVSWLDKDQNRTGGSRGQPPGNKPRANSVYQQQALDRQETAKHLLNSVGVKLEPDIGANSDFIEGDFTVGNQPRNNALARGKSGNCQPVAVIAPARNNNRPNQNSLARANQENNEISACGEIFG